MKCALLMFTLLMVFGTGLTLGANDRSTHIADKGDFDMSVLQKQTPIPPQEVLAAAQPPDGFALNDVQLASMDGEPVWCLRYEHPDGRNAWLGGEHFSCVVTPTGLIKGVTWMDNSLADGSLPQEEEAVAVAKRYLGLVAPDLLDRMKINWVRPHIETISIDDANGRQQISITGMKVKCRNSEDGRYFWVIVGPRNTIVTFERDIVWNTLRVSRQTEKWLHDEWLAERSKH